MNNAHHTRTARIEARLTPEALVLIKRAAAMEGRSVSDYIVAAAQEAARRTIEENSLIRLSGEDQRRFIDSLFGPVISNDALKRAKASHDALIIRR